MGSRNALKIVTNKSKQAYLYIDLPSWSICFSIDTSPLSFFFSSSSTQLYDYGRSGNPTRDTLEKCLASLDNGKYGLAFSSGLGVQTAICQLLSAGDHIISCDDIYGGTNRLFNKVIARQGITIDLVDANNLDSLKKVLNNKTRVSAIYSTIQMNLN